MPAITYFCPVAKNHPIGGVKVIHQHAEALADAGIDCFVFQPAKPEDQSLWFESRARTKTSNDFNPKRDFLVIPEVWAARFGGQSHAHGIKYAIFVQNGYMICDALDGSSAQLREAYVNASLILSISDDTSAMIALMYPEIPADKIVRVTPRISDQFAPGTKSKTISYMPRKLTDHATRMRSFLESVLPPDWEMISIHKQDERGVADVLAKSSIFLSFCDMEGFDLPPLEAALSGALVIGYTGQGANEYFHAPNFRRIENGNFKCFVEETKRAIEDIDAGLLRTDAFAMGINALKTRYSRERELDHLLAFARKVEALYAV
jgi:hypothetical protein